MRVYLAQAVIRRYIIFFHNELLFLMKPQKLWKKKMIFIVLSCCLVFCNTDAHNMRKQFAIVLRIFIGKSLGLGL